MHTGVSETAHIVTHPSLCDLPVTPVSLTDVPAHCSATTFVDKSQSHVIFQNFDCQRRFGTPRLPSACSEYVGLIATSDRKARRDLELAIIRASRACCPAFQVRIKNAVCTVPRMLWTGCLAAKLKTHVVSDAIHGDIVHSYDVPDGCCVNCYVLLTGWESALFKDRCICALQALLSGNHQGSAGLSHQA